MSSNNYLEKVKKLREITGVGFKDCKIVIDETNGDVEKSIELLRKKGIAKASKRMQRVAAEGLICISENENKFSITEINSETDFVAKNEQFLKFSKEVSGLALNKLGKIDDILNASMKNDKSVKDNLVDLISKIGEKITIRRSDFVESGNNISNFSYIHSPINEEAGKLGVIVSIETTKNKKDIQEIGKQLAMHIAASTPLAIDKDGLDKKILQKEKVIIMEELKSTGKDNKIVEKIANGKLNKFITDNTLLNQFWIMEPKKKVSEILKNYFNKEMFKIIRFIRFKVGEGL